MNVSDDKGIRKETRRVLGRHLYRISAACYLGRSGKTLERLLEELPKESKVIAARHRPDRHLGFSLHVITDGKIVDVEESEIFDNLHRLGLKKKKSKKLTDWSVD